MPNNKKNDSKFDQVIFLKVLIIFAVALIPLTFMVMDLSKRLSNFLSGKPGVVANQGVDFRVSLPANASGDLKLVPKDKIDSLFNNLKK
ncbi:MAG: hypothetical protein PHC97_01160 [Patescibacteria group bacterium]|nr:hypothetical protein [Patescibacteria group bacterium]